MTYIARQRISKHASLTIESVFSVWSVPRSYKRTQKTRPRGVVVEGEESRFGTPACRVVSFGTEELNLVESSEVVVEE
jgi:hypothetical protein